jgi:hypothetical protein
VYGTAKSSWYNGDHGRGDISRHGCRDPDYHLIFTAGDQDLEDKVCEGHFCRNVHAVLCGIFLWILYGVSINSLPVIITNIVTFILAFIILVLKLRNG